MRPATARCLVARGVAEPRDAQGFIDPRLAALRPPAGLAGLSLAVGRIADAVVRGERIGVFGDYDVDGVTTAALLTSFLRASGADGRVCGRAPRCGLRLHAGGGGRLRAARLQARRHRRLRHERSRRDSRPAIARGIEVIVVDHHTVPAADVGASRALARQSVPRRLDVPVPRHGVGRARLLRRGRRFAPSCATAVTSDRDPSRTSATCSTSSRSARSPISSRSPQRTGS